MGVIETLIITTALAGVAGTGLGGLVGALLQKGNTILRQTIGRTEAIANAALAGQGLIPNAGRQIRTACIAVVVQIVGAELTAISILTGDLIGSAAGNGIVAKIVTHDIRIALDPLIEFLLLGPGGHLIIEFIKANIRGEDLLVK